MTTDGTMASLIWVPRRAFIGRHTVAPRFQRKKGRALPFVSRFPCGSTAMCALSFVFSSSFSGGAGFAVVVVLVVGKKRGVVPARMGGMDDGRFWTRHRPHPSDYYHRLPNMYSLRSAKRTRSWKRCLCRSTFTVL